MPDARATSGTRPKTGLWNTSGLHLLRCVSGGHLLSCLAERLRLLHGDMAQFKARQRIKREEDEGKATKALREQLDQCLKRLEKSEEGAAARVR